MSECRWEHSIEHNLDDMEKWVEIELWKEKKIKTITDMQNKETHTHSLTNTNTYVRISSTHTHTCIK
jgi:hypothetical protein